MKTVFFLGISEEKTCSAHLSGITIHDEVLMYAVMSTKQTTEGKIPTSQSDFNSDISKARVEGKHLILVLRRQQMDC